MLAWVDELRLRGHRLLDRVEAGTACKILGHFACPLDLRHQRTEGAVRSLLLGIGLLEGALGSDLCQDLLQDKVSVLRLRGILRHQ